MQEFPLVYMAVMKLIAIVCSRYNFVNWISTKLGGQLKQYPLVERPGCIQHYFDKLRRRLENIKFSKGKCENTNKPKAEVLNGGKPVRVNCEKRLEESHSARINLVKVLGGEVKSYSGLQ